MIVVDLDWFTGEDHEDSDAIVLFQSYIENLLAKLEEELEAEFQRSDTLLLNRLSVNGVLIIPELCFELHHRILPHLWNEDLMRKALYCLAVGWDLTRSMARFLIDCFESGSHSTAVELFEDYNGLDALWQHLRSKSSDKRGQARLVLFQYYIAVAQRPQEVASRIFHADFVRIKNLDVFQDVVKRVFQILQVNWSTNYERITLLRKKQLQEQHLKLGISIGSFSDDDLTANFRNILQCYDRYRNRDIWREIIIGISKINKRNPPPFGIRAQFISTFEAIEELKEKLEAQGPAYDLYVAMEPGDFNPIDP
jgi:hypothetical protein